MSLITVVIVYDFTSVANQGEKLKTAFILYANGHKNSVVCFAIWFYNLNIASMGRVLHMGLTLLQVAC